MVKRTLVPMIYLLQEHRAQCSSQHMLAFFRCLGQELAGEMNAVALPVAALTTPVDRIFEAGVGGAHHQLHA